MSNRNAFTFPIRAPFLVPVALVFGCTSVLAQQPAPNTTHGMSPTAHAYLDKALSSMEQHSMRRRQIDWVSLRRTAFDRAANAQGTRDTYDAIQWAVKSLNDGHSFFSTPPASATPDIQGKATASTSSGPSRDRTRTKVPAQRKTKTRTIPGAGWVIASSAEDLRGELITGATGGAGTRIGYLLLPSFGGEESFDPARAAEFATAVQGLIRHLEGLGATDWIVDLRYNSGGNMWPMLAGVGPLLGADRVGAFVADEETPVAWEYKDGSAGTPGSVSVSVANPHQLQNPRARVAVLIGKYCTSSGEAIAVAFRGRERSRFFGKPSGGATTSTQTVWMGDGAMLFVTNAIFADRRGTTYGGKVTPDEVVADSPDELATPAPRLLGDAGVHAALSWLRQGK